MLSPEQVRSLRAKLISIQIISGALIAGVLVFVAITCLITDWEELSDQLKMLTLIGAMTGVVMFALSIVAPGMFAGGPAHSEKDETKALQVIVNSLMTENLIRFVLIEAAIFLNLMVFFIEPHRATLIVVAIGILLMLVCFPRQSKLISKIESRKD